MRREKRLEQMIDKRGFNGTVKWIAHRTDMLDRKGQVRLLYRFERDIESAIARDAVMANIWHEMLRSSPVAIKLTKARLAKIEALADESQA